jgi:hypothetical protein
MLRQPRLWREVSRELVRPVRRRNCPAKSIESRLRSPIRIVAGQREARCRQARRYFIDIW